MTHDDDACKLIEGFEQCFQTARIQFDKIIPVPQIMDNIAEPVFVFKNFAPRSSVEFITIILAYDPSNFNLFSKLWANIESNRLERIGLNIPRPYLDYHQIKYEGVTYHPYSVAISEFKLIPNDVLKVLSDFYEHCRFNGN